MWQLTDIELLAVLSLFAHLVVEALSDFERELMFDVLERFALDPDAFAMTLEERRALDDALAALAQADERAAA